MTMTLVDRTGVTGYSLPLSPNGTSSMLTPPPWHFTGDVVMIDYRVDPEAALRFLPAELAPGPDAGAAAAVFAQWQWCSDDGAERAEPGRTQFAEFLVLLSCAHNGQPVARCPYAWVDQHVPLVRGWVQGMPKQFGEIHQTRPSPLGVAGSRVGQDGRFDGTLSVHGRRVAEATVRLEERGSPPPLHTVPLVHTRMFPAWVPSEVATSQLVCSEVTGVEFSEVWTGRADLRFFDSLDADFQLLRPVEVGAGHVFSYAETLVGGRLLA
jgi:enduracididine biosynthesis enzyme MppR